MDNRTAGWIRRGHLTCHCLLVEYRNGLVLLDTGLGLQDVRNPSDRISRFFLGLLRPDFREEMTAIRQIEMLGYSAQDVRHILMTHLDFDHAGGLDDFPDATVHMLQDERDDAFSQRTWLDRQRYRPQQWSHRRNWKVYRESRGESWFGFKQVQELEGVPPEIVMIPLIGHTLGHTGIAVQDGNSWRLLAGDAYFYHAEMNPTHPWCTPGLRLYQFMMEKNREARLSNQNRLRKLIDQKKEQVTVFCSHDLLEFERLSGRSAKVPIEKFSLAA